MVKIIPFPNNNVVLVGQAANQKINDVIDMTIPPYDRLLECVECSKPLPDCKCSFNQQKFNPENKGRPPLKLVDCGRA